MLIATVFAAPGAGSGSGLRAPQSRRAGGPALHWWSIALSVSVHVGVPWIATLLVTPDAAPWQQEVQLLNAAPTLERSGPDTVIPIEAPGTRDPVAATPPESSAPGERRRAPDSARQNKARRVARARRPSQVAAHQPSEAPATGARPPSSTSGAVASREGAAAGVLARYLRAARERVMQHRQYPHLARRARLEGTVCLRLSITASGAVRQVRVTCGQSQELLVDAALQSVTDATPFSPLPSALGRELTLELPVVFELAR